MLVKPVSFDNFDRRCFAGHSGEQRRHDRSPRTYRDQGGPWKPIIRQYTHALKATRFSWLTVKSVCYLS